MSKIICLPDAMPDFCLDDSNLTKSLQMSFLKPKITRCINMGFQNLTRNVLDQKESNLCVPISVATLICHAVKNDLTFEYKNGVYSFENVFNILTMIIYPRSMAGLDLNPNQLECEFQENQIETLLKRMEQRTFVRKSGWRIMAHYGGYSNGAPWSKFYYKQEYHILAKLSVFLHENYLFERPLTVTGAYLLDDGEVFFHQMVLDRIENDEYILQNTQFSAGGSLLKIKKRDAYYARYDFIKHQYDKNLGEFVYFGDNNESMRLVNENINMEANKWYLLPQAYMIYQTDKFHH